MRYKAKDRMILVNKKNTKKIFKYFYKETDKDFDLTWAVNYLVDIAIGELQAIDDMYEKEEKELKNFYNQQMIYIWKICNLKN